jgi:class 3 adenylate cyclase
MEGMCRNLGKYGGDIIKFVGDAMIIMWPQPENVPEADRRENAQFTCRKAIQCAIDIQKEMNNFQVIQGVASLSVKIGIGFGKCALLYVGGVFGRAEYFTVGPSLTCALKSEEQATEGGQIIVNSSAYQHVRDFY